MEKRVSSKALLPFGVFVGVYLITGIVLNSQGVEMAFYQLPAPIAALIGVLSAFVLFKGKVDDKLAVFLKGSVCISCISGWIKCIYCTDRRNPFLGSYWHCYGIFHNSGVCKSYLHRIHRDV